MLTDIHLVLLCMMVQPFCIGVRDWDWVSIILKFVMRHSGHAR